MWKRGTGLQGKEKREQDRDLHQFHSVALMAWHGTAASPASQRDGW